MVVNLCLPHFKTSVQCNKLCADGYDVSNLLSRDAGVRLRGFKLEYFLRPPVHVTLRFQFRVELCRVDVALWPQGMDLTGTPRGLEIHTCSDPLPRGEGPEAEFDQSQFRLVGRCEMKEGTWVSFGQPRIQPRPPFLGPPLDPPLGARQQELWSRGPQSLSSVTGLRICLPYGGAGSPLGLKALAVWGLPACCCPPQTVEWIVRAHRASQRPPSLRPTSPVPPPPAQEPAAAAPDPDVPEEFLDPLTQELMVLPMLLPSGVVIDSGTLEEYQRREATWGRSPNDPFTAVPFSQESQPVPCPELKGRIDRFLLQAGDGAGRLGRKVRQDLPHPSSLVPTEGSGGCPLVHTATPLPPDPPCREESPSRHVDSALTRPLTQPPSAEAKGAEIPLGGVENGRVWLGLAAEQRLLKGAGRNRNQWTGVAPSRRKRALEGSRGGWVSFRAAPPLPCLDSLPPSPLSPPPERLPTPLKKLKTEAANPASSGEQGSSSISHEQRLSDSLDKALSTALQAFPAFCARRGSRNQEVDPAGNPAGENRCGYCSCALSTYPTCPPAFRLPCKHLVCRPCLSLRGQLKAPGPPLSCPICQTQALPSAITRVHY